MFNEYNKTGAPRIQYAIPTPEMAGYIFPAHSRQPALQRNPHTFGRNESQILNLVFGIP